MLPLLPGLTPFFFTRSMPCIVVHLFFISRLAIQNIENISEDGVPFHL